jgi:hypothetical protein
MLILLESAFGVWEILLWFGVVSFNLLRHLDCLFSDCVLQRLYVGLLDTLTNYRASTYYD